MAMNESAITMTFYGVRGSAPAYRDMGTHYGVNTSCALLRAGGRTIVVDLGTGALVLGDVLARETGEIDVLQSHMHIDHLQGLPFFTPFFQKGRVVRVYSEERLGKTVSEQLDQFTASPLWPIQFSTFPADVRCETFTENAAFSLGEHVRVATAHSNHPDLSTLFRVSCGGKTLVYALDFEHSGDYLNALTAFAEGADLLVFDATYTEAEYEAGKQGWGHSTWERGLALWRSGICDRVALSHLSHVRPDSELDALSKTLEDASGGKCFLAREGMTVTL